MSAAFGPDGARIVTASADHTARLWDATTGASLAVLEDGLLVKSAGFSPDGARIATFSLSTARLWDGRSGAPVAEPVSYTHLTLPTKALV